MRILENIIDIFLLERNDYVIVSEKYDDIEGITVMGEYHGQIINEFSESSLLRINKPIIVPEFIDIKNRNMYELKDEIISKQDFSTETLWYQFNLKNFPEKITITYIEDY